MTVPRGITRRSLRLSLERVNGEPDGSPSLAVRLPATLRSTFNEAVKVPAMFGEVKAFTLRLDGVALRHPAQPDFAGREDRHLECPICLQAALKLPAFIV